MQNCIDSNTATGKCLLLSHIFVLTAVQVYTPAAIGSDSVSSGIILPDLTGRTSGDENITSDTTGLIPHLRLGNISEPIVRGNNIINSTKNKNTGGLRKSPLRLWPHDTQK